MHAFVDCHVAFITTNDTSVTLLTMLRNITKPGINS